MIRARLIVSIAILMATITLAGAQNYPNHLIKLMHGFPAGGNVDVLARIMAEEMSKGLGQSIIIEAKPGVVGSPAAETVTRRPPTVIRCYSCRTRMQSRPRSTSRSSTTPSTISHGSRQ